MSPGSRGLRATAAGADGRFADLFAALQHGGHHAEPAIYHDDFADEVHNQLVNVDVAMVWVNPIHDGQSRVVLDDMLRRISESGVHVSTHPDVIVKIGTKRVLYDTADFDWGVSTNLYESANALREGLAGSLTTGPRVLKQHRGSSGDGVWRVELTAPAAETVSEATTVRVRQAKRGSPDELLAFADFCDRCDQYLSYDGLLVDQAFQPRLSEGMVRCYLVKGQVAGFGLQATNALIPSVGGEAPEPSKRLYHPPTLPEHQRLKAKLEQTWVPQLQERFDIANDRLPLLWDCDFLKGQRDESGQDTHVLCEINVSSVAPYPESAIAHIVAALDEL